MDLHTVHKKISLTSVRICVSVVWWPSNIPNRGPHTDASAMALCVSDFLAPVVGAMFEPIFGFISQDGKLDLSFSNFWACCQASLAHTKFQHF